MDEILKILNEYEALTAAKKTMLKEEINGITDDDEESWYQWIAKESSPPENEERRYHV